MLLRLADPEERYAAVRLRSDLPASDFERHDSEWQLRLAPPPVARLEYQLEVEHADGGSELLLDPANPNRAPGAFGEKSVLLLEGYVPPEWLGEHGVEGACVELLAPGRGLGADVPVQLWSPADADPAEPLPLLAAHDGPEFDELSSLTHFTSVAIARGALPRHRVALLAPGARNEWYSASPLYAGALARGILPALREAVAVRGPVVGMGASLGALAMLHTHWRHPGTFGALFLQSGSFFTPRFDAHERRFSRYPRVVAFVGEVLGAGASADPVPVTLTCGSAEENVDNNRLMASALAAQGHPVVLHEVPDMHNYTAWRDALDPYLAELAERVW